jgi:PAS domain S-box-containing protein
MRFGQAPAPAQITIAVPRQGSSAETPGKRLSSSKVNAAARIIATPAREASDLVAADPPSRPGISDGRLVDVNSAYARMIGRSIEQTLELTYWDITPAGYAAQEQQQLDRLEKTGSYGPYEKEYRHSDGRLVPVRLQGCLIERRGERFIWSTVEDISEYRRAEVQNVEQLEELRRWHQATLGREMRILKLKAEVNAMAVQLGEPPRYPGGMSDEAAALRERELTVPAGASCAAAAPADGK